MRMSRSFSQSSKTRDGWPQIAKRVEQAGAGRADSARAAASTSGGADPGLGVHGEVRRGGIGLRLQVALATGTMVFVIAGLLGGILAQNSAARLRLRVGQTLQNDATQIADQLNRQMSARARELFLLGSLNPMRALRDASQAQALLTELRSQVPAYYWLGITDQAGHMVVATNAELLGGDFSNRPEIREGLRGYSTGSEGAVLPPAAGSPGAPPIATEPQPITLSHPVIAPDGGIAGVVVAQLHWNWMRDLADGILGQPEATGSGEAAAERSFVLLNDQDRVLLGPPDLMGRTLGLAAAARARGGYVGWSTESWPDGRSYLTGAALVQPQQPAPAGGATPMQTPLHWTVLTREDAAFVAHSNRVLRLRVALGGVTLALVAACIGWLGAGLITAPLRRIADAADLFSRGEATDLPRIVRPREIHALAEALRRMVATFGTHQVALDTMETIARHDPLTGVMNREGLRAWLTERMGPDGLPLGTLMVFLADLDGFKPINDQLGHQAGDAALVEVAARMARFMRPNDAVARFGGDEFLVILDAPLGTADEAAEATIFDLFDAVSLEPYDLGPDLRVPIGVSIGGAMWPGDGQAIDEVIGKADAALYAAKRAGKARIIMHQPEYGGHEQDATAVI